MFSQIEFEDELEKNIREYLERAKRPLQTLPEQPEGKMLKEAVAACLLDLRSKHDELRKEGSFGRC